jgi:hypothetical protein
MTASAHDTARTDNAKMMSTAVVMPIPIPLTCRPSIMGSMSNPDTVCFLDVARLIDEKVGGDQMV